MLGEPPVPISVVTSLLAEHWRVREVVVEYMPIGFGSYHWSAVTERARLFVTLDDFGYIADAQERAHQLDATVRAYKCASHLLDSGCQFVRAPISTAGGEVAVQTSQQHVYSVWPYVEGRSSTTGEYQSDDDLRAVVDVLGELHTVERARIDVDYEGFRPVYREFLERVLAEPGDRWDSGPYGERARVLLEQNSAGIHRLLAHYDHLVGTAPERDDWVLTHGQPHTGNVVFSTDRGPVLIDWESAAIAPRERDLWMLMTSNPHIAGAYSGRTGYEPDPNMLKLYAAYWELSEFGITFSDFCNPHTSGGHEIVKWNVLNGYLPIEPRWPEA